MNKLKQILGSICLVALMSSCGGGEDGDVEPVEYHSVSDKFTAEGKKYKGVTVSSAKYNEHIEKIQICEGSDTFLIPERKGQITSYKCSECHSEPIAKLQNLQNGKKAHWNIKINHAGKDIMNCKTCHNVNDMDHLQSFTDQPIDFNLSYKVCSQCHSEQFKDWKGGAHGKRLGGWAPPRVSNTCVNCHNPHDPHFETRYPARFNTQKVKERN